MSQPYWVTLVTMVKLAYNNKVWQLFFLSAPPSLPFLLLICCSLSQRDARWSRLGKLYEFIPLTTEDQPIRTLSWDWLRMQEERRPLCQLGLPSFPRVNYNQVVRHIYRHVLSPVGANKARTSQLGSQQETNGIFGLGEFKAGFICLEKCGHAVEKPRGRVQWLRARQAEGQEKRAEGSWKPGGETVSRCLWEGTAAGCLRRGTPSKGKAKKTSWQTPWAHSPVSYQSLILSPARSQRVREPPLMHPLQVGL